MRCPHLFAESDERGGLFGPFLEGKAGFVAHGAWSRLARRPAECHNQGIWLMHIAVTSLDFINHLAHNHVDEIYSLLFIKHLDLGFFAPAPGCLVARKGRGK